MKFTVSKRFEFEAAHSLPHLPEGHKCRRVHGHSYAVEIFCSNPLDERGFVVDYAELSAAMAPILERLDHHNLNDVMWFPTTAENLGAWLLDELVGKLPVAVSRVDVYETANTRVTVER